MITKREITVQQKLEVYACSACDFTTPGKDTAASHYVLNHLPQHTLPPGTTPAGGDWFVAHLIWCDTPAEHQLLTVWRGRSGVWDGPGWYATIWRSADDEGPEHRVASLTSLVTRAVALVADARATHVGLRRLTKTVPVRP